MQRRIPICVNSPFVHARNSQSVRHILRPRMISMSGTSYLVSSKPVGDNIHLGTYHSVIMVLDTLEPVKLSCETNGAPFACCYFDRLPTWCSAVLSLNLSPPCARGILWPSHAQNVTKGTNHRKESTQAQAFQCWVETPPHAFACEHSFSVILHR